MVIMAEAISGHKSRRIRSGGIRDICASAESEKSVDRVVSSCRGGEDQFLLKDDLSQALAQPVANFIGAVNALEQKVESQLDAGQQG